MLVGIIIGMFLGLLVIVGVKRFREMTCSDTRFVTADNGMKVELAHDQPNELANIIVQCFETGEAVSATIDEDGKVTKGKLNDTEV
jgi:hypothetical protein